MQITSWNQTRFQVWKWNFQIFLKKFIPSFAVVHQHFKQLPDAEWLQWRERRKWAGSKGHYKVHCRCGTDFQVGVDLFVCRRWVDWMSTDVFPPPPLCVIFMLNQLRRLHILVSVILRSVTQNSPERRVTSYRCSQPPYFMTTHPHLHRTPQSSPPSRLPYQSNKLNNFFEGVFLWKMHRIQWLNVSHALFFSPSAATSKRGRVCHVDGGSGSMCHTKKKKEKKRRRSCTAARHNCRLHHVTFLDLWWLGCTCYIQWSK